MKSLLLTNEFPPNVYGGAGVHVEYLSRELAQLIDVDVRCFGEQDVADANPAVKGVTADKTGWTAPASLQSVFAALQNCLNFNTRNIDADVVHLHTWYSHFGGILAKMNYGIPMVLTVHSLEPLRPWKREQLGGGYDFTCWLEKTAIEMADAVVAVSQETKEDILRLFDVDPEKVHIIYNGIDPDEYTRVDRPEVLEKHGVDSNKPFVLFVGRITRQKGIIHLVSAIRSMDEGFQVVLLAGAPDTPEIAREMADVVAEIQKERDDVIWIPEMLPNDEKIAMYSHARVFCCPSIYEPFGIINLEAMACETAVVASAVGGIKEVVVSEETGLLVAVEQQTESPFEPIDPDRFSSDLADGINRLMADPDLCKRMGAAGRQRAKEVFSWKAIANRTVELYRSLL